MAERASLKRPFRLVNRVAAFTLVFYCAACGGKDEKSDTPNVKTLQTPIIWQTTPFGQTIWDFAISDDTPVQIAVSSEAGIEIIDIDGTLLSSQPGSYESEQLATGVLTEIEGASLRMYPAIRDLDSLLTLYTYGSGLYAPIELEIDNPPEMAMSGLCASASDDGILNIGYWTQLDPSVLQMGKISDIEGKLTFEETGTIAHEKYLTSCAMDGDLIVAGGGFGVQIDQGDDEPILINTPGVPVELAVSEQYSRKDALIAMTLQNDQVYAANLAGALGRLIFEPGLSSDAPEKAGALALSKTGSVGGLPQGFLAVESINGDDTQIIYADRQTILDQLSPPGE